MTLQTRRIGAPVAASPADLARVWRAGRASARPGAFPGLLDGIVESFLAAAVEALAHGRDAALVWPATAGVVRLASDPRRTREEFHAEWDLLEEVVGAALRAQGADEAALAWISRAVALGRAGSLALGVRPGGGPPGVLTVTLYSDPALTRARAGARR